MYLLKTIVFVGFFLFANQINAMHDFYELKRQIKINDLNKRQQLEKRYICFYKGCSRMMSFDEFNVTKFLCRHNILV